jgi:polysaccharide biosynthesis/export protein
MRIENTVMSLSTLERGVLAIAQLALLLVLSLLPTGTVMADSASTSPAYRIGPNDLIRIQVFGEDDLTVESKVAGDGTINFPLLGPVPVAGKSVKELQEYLAERLAEGYVRSPKVTVLMVRYRNFYMTGEVKAPGGYPYESGLTVQKAISLAGGFTEKAETRKIAATRVMGNRTDTVSLGQDSPILPDDILTVGAMQKFYVTGEVKTPGRYAFEQGLTIQKALSMAGGLTEKADSTAIKVTRLSETTVKTLTVGSDEVIFPDDLIVVEGQTRRFYVSGEVKAPGGYPYKEGLNVQKALAMAGGLTDKAEKNDLRVIRQVGGHEESMTVAAHSSVLAEDTIVVAEGQRFYLSGEVSKPGRYLYEAGLTVQKALSMGGGFTEKADKAGITVNRLQGGAVRALALDNQALLLPEDEIVVPQLRKVFVEGEVKKPGHLLFEKGMTVHMAIAMAGGFTDKAAKTSTKVLRSINGQERAIEIALDSPILPEDIIVVPQRFF